jgi:hypothetical protein
MLLAQAAPSALAQDFVQETQGLARKFDEFGQVGGCDGGARLDNFAIQLQNEKDATGYVICYGPAGKGGGSAEGRCRLTEEYLVNTRGIDPSRFRIILGGLYKEIGGSATELWLSPSEAEPPKPHDYGNPGKSFTGRLAEFNTSDALYGVYEEMENTGPSFGNSPYAGLVDVLGQQPDTIGYIVAFNSQSAAPGAWRRGAREVAGALESGYGLGSDRIKIIYGGYRKLDDDYSTARVELWALPASAPPPVAEVKEPEPRPDKAVQIVSVDETALGYQDNSQRAFEGFADILKADRQMRACIIIRAESETEAEAEETEQTEGEAVEAKSEEAEAEQAEVAETNEPKVDLVQLVEKWKSDLEEKYGISRDRLVVIFGSSSRDYRGALLETWVVPPGAQLPDPNAFDEEQTPSAEEMSQAADEPQQ